MNSIQMINQNFEEIQQEISQDSNLQNKSLPTIIKMLINQVHELTTKFPIWKRKKDFWKSWSSNN